MSDLVGNPKDRFSHDTAHLIPSLSGIVVLLQFISGGHIVLEVVHSAMRPLLLMLGDHRNLDLNVIQRLSSLTQLFPNTFNEKLCEQLLVRLGVCKLKSDSLKCLVITCMCGSLTDLKYHKLALLFRGMDIVIIHFSRINLFLVLYEPRCEKTSLRGFRPGPAQTRLYNHTR